MNRWTPSNRACVRICGILLIAHRQGRIELGYQDALRVREGCFSTRFHARTRALLGRLWTANGGVRLLEITGRTENVPSDIRDELGSAEERSA